MVDAVAARTAPSPRELQQSTPPASDSRGTSPAATMPATPEQNDAVIIDLSDDARAVLAQASSSPQTPGASAEDLAGLIRFEERFKLMTEYAALHQELAFISDKTAAYALDKTFQDASAQEDESRDAAGARGNIDRYVERREELMPRFAELTRKLGALPGQEKPEEPR
jgi:hypothetical protein